jgi:hypothetical protein
VTPDPHPFAGIDLVLIDGNNLLHRVSAAAGPGPLRRLLPSLRAAIPRSVETIVMLDGPADPGTTPRQLASPGIEFRHSGRVDADTALVTLLGTRPYHERHRTVVVTDDRSLGDRVRAAGGTPRRLEWLQRLLDRTASDAPVHRRPPSRPGRVRDDDRIPDDGGARGADVPDDDEPTPWQPGRGATRKRGNPRRRPRRCG